MEANRNRAPMSWHEFGDIFAIATPRLQVLHGRASVAYSLEYFGLWRLGSSFVRALASGRGEPREKSYLHATRQVGE